MSTKALLSALAASAALLGFLGCGEDNATAPESSPALSQTEKATLADEVRQLTAGRGITRLREAPSVRPALVRLGRALAFDKILSGNHDISCMTCHLPTLETGDARSLSIGQGATGFGVNRVHPQGIFIPRNAPALFNIFALRPLFWDGRVFKDRLGTFHTEAGSALTLGMTKVFEFGTLSALPLFPVLSRSEMRANSGNELAAIADSHPERVWRALMGRLGRIPEYRRLFEEAYPGRRFDGMTFAHASNAIAGFLVSELAFNNSPWDRFLAGDDGALTPVQLQGAKNFMVARCSICHNGPAFTDNKFHNVAVAQIGPGKGDGTLGKDDFGRMRVTGKAKDRYAFRTPSLRNVELTGPYGHDGAYVDLRAFVDHYSVSDAKLMGFGAAQLPQLEPLLQGTLLSNLAGILETRDTLLKGVVFTDRTVDAVTQFMKALTDPAAKHLQRVIPRKVPSGLPVDGAGGAD